MKIPVIKNTVTNYVKMFVSLCEGILVARWITGYLGMEAYGVWTLLWSFFVYALLLDFGCGAAAQKYTSSGLYCKDTEGFNRIVSTIFTFHVMMAGVIAAATFGCSFFLSFLPGMGEKAMLSDARTCFLILGFGSALLFPTGIFPEMLVGLQKMYLRNFIVIVSKLLELVGALAVFHFGGTLVALVVFVMAAALAGNLAMACCVLRTLPDLRIRFAWDRDKWCAIVGFSGYVYLGMLSNLVLRRSSRLLVGFFCGVADVGVFQLSSKLSDLCSQAVNQYQENISPITGALHKRGKIAALGRIVFGAMQWNAYAAFGTMATAFILADPALNALFKTSSPEMVRLSRWFLVSLYFGVVLKNVPQRYFMMSESHRFATLLLSAEAAANLGLNLLLIKQFGMVVVLYNSIALRLVLATFIFLPRLLREMKVSVWRFIIRIFVLPAAAGIPSILWLMIFLRFSEAGPWATVLLGGGVSGGLYLTMMLLLCPIPSKVKRLIGRVRGLKTERK